MAALQRFQRLPAPLAETLAKLSYDGGSSALKTAGQIRKYASAADLSVLDASKGGRERIVILGSGWAGRNSQC